tara:strand:+ start:581 stop:808 length:228 start_codon:yes stop_codon:yes gene_type:complete
MSEKRKCSARARRVEIRPHWRAGKSDKGHPIVVKEDGFNERFYCRLEEGHEGSHHDTYKMVAWTETPSDKQDNGG